MSAFGLQLCWHSAVSLLRGEQDTSLGHQLKRGCWYDSLPWIFAWQAQPCTAWLFELGRCPHIQQCILWGREIKWCSPCQGGFSLNPAEWGVPSAACPSITALLPLSLFLSPTTCSSVVSIIQGLASHFQLQVLKELVMPLVVMEYFLKRKEHMLFSDGELSFLLCSWKQRGLLELRFCSEVIFKPGAYQPEKGSYQVVFNRVIPLLWLGAEMQPYLKERVIGNAETPLGTHWTQSSLLCPGLVSCTPGCRTLSLFCSSCSLWMGCKWLHWTWSSGEPRPAALSKQPMFSKVPSHFGSLGIARLNWRTVKREKFSESVSLLLLCITGSLLAHPAFLVTLELHIVSDKIVLVEMWSKQGPSKPSPSTQASEHIIRHTLLCKERINACATQVADPLPSLCQWWWWMDVIFECLARGPWPPCSCEWWDETGTCTNLPESTNKAMTKAALCFPILLGILAIREELSPAHLLFLEACQLPCPMYFSDGDGENTAMFCLVLLSSWSQLFPLYWPMCV